MTNYHKKFIADKKIQSVELAERKTYQGNDVYKIKFRDDTEDEMPVAIFKKLVSDSSLDLSSYVKKLSEIITEDFLKILLEAEVRVEWVQHITSSLNLVMEKMVNKANDTVWKKDVNHITFADLDRVLDLKKVSREDKTIK